MGKIYSDISNVFLCENRYILEASIISQELFTWSQLQEIK